MQIADLIRYNHIVRGLYVDALTKLPWSEVVADKGLSFDSMRDVFLHLTLVEDRWVSFIIPGRVKEWVDPDFNAFQDVAALKKYADDVKARTEAYLSRLSDAELMREVTVFWGGKPTDITVEKGLTHMVVEDLIHYGELSAALWQMGLEAPYWGFWRYGLTNPKL